MKIYLLGLTGAGKSTIGKQLALKLSYPFIDLDEIIQYETGKSIEQIFDSEGEGKFRELENFYLKRVSETNHRIISTGGGTPCFYNGIDFIKSNGLSIFLYTPVEIIAERLFNSDVSQRPMLKGKSIEELKYFLDAKLNERLPVYAKSDFTIDTTIAGSTEDLATFLNSSVRMLEKILELRQSEKTIQQ